MPGRTFFPKLSKFITFAAAPSVLTPFVRNQAPPARRPHVGGRERERERRSEREGARERERESEREIPGRHERGIPQCPAGLAAAAAVATLAAAARPR